MKVYSEQRAQHIARRDMGARLLNGPLCAHPDALPVESGGELVAALCPDCDRQLPAEWIGCEHPETVEITSLGDQYPVHLCQACGGAFAARPARTRPGA